MSTDMKINKLAFAISVAFNPDDWPTPHHLKSSILRWVM
jgi:hypothetical protein